MIDVNNDNRYVSGMTSPARPLIDRSGMSAVTWLLLALAVISVVLAVAGPLQQFSEPGATVPVMLYGDAADRAGVALDLPDLPAGTHLHTADDEFELRVDELPAGLRLLSQASTSLLLLSVAGGAWCLAMVLRTIRVGQPFDRRNPGRLTGLALVVVGASLVPPVLDDVAAHQVLDHLGLLELDSPFVFAILDLPFNGPLYAAIVLAFAEAFRRGATLADDVDGLV